MWIKTPIESGGRPVFVTLGGDDIMLLKATPGSGAGCAGEVKNKEGYYQETCPTDADAACRRDRA
jgi:hypothetical protein